MNIDDQVDCHADLSQAIIALRKLYDEFQEYKKCYDQAFEKQMES